MIIEYKICRKKILDLPYSPFSVLRVNSILSFIFATGSIAQQGIQ
jgi:hypothetical protein